MPRKLRMLPIVARVQKWDKSGRLSIYQVAHPKREDRDAVENSISTEVDVRTKCLVKQVQNFTLLYGVSFITRHNLPSTLKIIGRHYRAANRHP